MSSHQFRDHSLMQASKGYNDVSALQDLLKDIRTLTTLVLHFQQFPEQNEDDCMYLMLLQLTQKLFFNPLVAENLLHAAVEFIFQRADEKREILRKWTESIFPTILDQINFDNFVRMIIVAKFVIEDDWLIFDEVKLIKILTNNLEFVFGDCYDINVLQVFVAILMNNPSQIDQDFMSYLFQQYELQQYQQKLILHPLICQMYLFSSQFFTKEMLDILLANVFEFSSEAAGELDLVRCILKDTQDESYKEMTRKFISTLNLDIQDENYYNYLAFVENCAKLI